MTSGAGLAIVQFPAAPQCRVQEDAAAGSQEEGGMDTQELVCGHCGAKLRCRAGTTAGRFRCPKCDTVQAVASAMPSAAGAGPSAEPPASGLFGRMPAAPSAAAVQERAALAGALAAANRSGRRFFRWAFLLTIAPLVWYTFAGQKEQDLHTVASAFREKLAARIASDAMLQEEAEKVNWDAPSLEVLAFWARVFADNEFQAALAELGPKVSIASKSDKADVVGALSMAFMVKHSGLKPAAFLTENTWAHWGLGALAAAAFLLYFCFAYPRGNARVSSLLKVGAFTGTVGIVLLLTVQFLSGLATRVRLHGRGILVAIWLILAAIAFSYAAADDPDNGFLLSFLGFTAGVGLLEELCKALPVVYHYRHGGDLGWRGACLWGLVSGAGFGVSEGIMYSARYYNGEAALGMYVVRFVSCVAMHAAWAGAAAILMCRRRDYLKGPMDWGDWARALGPALAVPMVLHGLYDTLLKMDMAPWALAVGAASFAYFVWLQEREAWAERREAEALLVAAKLG